MREEEQLRFKAEREAEKAWTDSHHQIVLTNMRIDTLLRIADKLANRSD